MRTFDEILTKARLCKDAAINLTVPEQREALESFSSLIEKINKVATNKEKIIFLEMFNQAGKMTEIENIAEEIVDKIEAETENKNSSTSLH